MPINILLALGILFMILILGILLIFLFLLSDIYHRPTLPSHVEYGWLVLILLAILPGLILTGLVLLRPPLKHRLTITQRLAALFVATLLAVGLYSTVHLAVIGRVPTEDSRWQELGLTRGIYSALPTEKKIEMLRKMEGYFTHPTSLRGWMADEIYKDPESIPVILDAIENMLPRAMEGKEPELSVMDALASAWRFNYLRRKKDSDAFQSARAQKLFVEYGCSASAKSPLFVLEALYVTRNDALPPNETRYSERIEWLRRQVCTP